MAISIPMPITDFADLLALATVSWKLVHRQETSGLSSGLIRVKDFGPPLYQADCTTIELFHEKARRIEARINALDGGVGSFYLYDPRLPGPQEDPKGTILGAATPVIASIGSNNKSLTLSGLPGGYVLTEGDYFCFDFGTPGRRAFHEFSERRVASGGGVTPLIEIRPHLQPGVTTGLAVTLIKPAMKCMIRPGSLEVQGTARGTTVISFKVIQDLR